MEGLSKDLMILYVFSNLALAFALQKTAQSVQALFADCIPLYIFSSHITGM